MKKSVTKRLLTALAMGLIILSLAVFVIPDGKENGSFLSSSPGQDSSVSAPTIASPKLSPIETKAARWEYFHKLLQDPETNRIPPNIRNRELNFARTLPTAQQALQRAKTKNPQLQAIDYNWQQAGPLDVGGRTRALAVDQRNSDIILAGGVSGGMWKSTNGGQSWNLKTPDLPNLSVTSVAQDPTNPDTWYYASGEVIRNSASAVGAPYYGQGIYKSTDNGETWNLMPQASSDTQGLVDTYNTVSRIRVSPTTGTIFISSTGFGIYRSTDGQSFSSSPVLGTEGEQLFCDVAIASDGTVAAVISEASFDDQQSQNSTHNHNPGVFISTDDGQTWTEATPSSFPSTHRRSVLHFAPSNPDILYVFTLKGTNDTDNQGVSFHKLNLATGDAFDRSGNLPDFRTESGDGTGYVNTQGGYNMVVDVKPDNENYVFVGATNLFRSSNGFATKPSGGYDAGNSSQKDQYWIGGYNQDNTARPYPNQHPDQHIIAFPEPNTNPNLMWAGHDGGLSRTSDVTASEVSWVNRDEGYITSQFYATAIPGDSTDNRLVGGTQDNGSPYFIFDQSGSQNSEDRSSGDGGYADFTANHIFTSSQRGRVLRWNNSFTELSYVQPIDAENQLFIHPYQVDPNDENVMYYPEDNHLWRNTDMDQISNQRDGSGTSTGWDELANITVGPNHEITALEVSNIPGNILYFAGSSDNAAPVLRRLENAKSATDGETDISLPDQYQQNLSSGAYVKDIAINPVNANEVIVVLSNYNITGLYHTTDGGENWQAIEGNLTGNSTNPGVSLRSAAIVPAESGSIYLVGSSAGLYSTQALDGTNTTWGQEATGNIGYAITEHLALRTSDGDIAAGTHGRGIFAGDFKGNTNAPFIIASPAEGRPGDVITLTAHDFTFNNEPSANTVTFGGAEATVQSASSSELKVEVPRGVIDRQAPSRSVILKVSTGSESIFTNFRMLPPTNFAISQNYPNPFNPSTTIPFDIPADSRVSLVIYNTNGQIVLRPIWKVEYTAGTYNTNVSFNNLASGVYIYRVTARTATGETHMDSKKMTLIK